MPWNLLDSPVLPPFGNESWQISQLPAATGLIAYGLILKVPASTPVGWNTGGYFGVGQLVANKLTIGQTHPLPLVGRGHGQALRTLGADDSDVITTQQQALYVFWYVHKWVAPTAFEIWGLVP